MSSSDIHKQIRYATKRQCRTAHYQLLSQFRHRMDWTRRNSRRTSGQFTSKCSAQAVCQLKINSHESDFRHPLFSLLALLLEKCEQATQGYISSSTSSTNSTHSNSPSPNGTNGNCDGDSFSRDVQVRICVIATTTARDLFRMGAKSPKVECICIIFHL